MFEKLYGARKSLTVWFNSAAVMMAVALPILQDSLPQLQAFVSQGAYNYIALAIAIVNILLRFKTCLPLENK